MKTTMPVGNHRRKLRMTTAATKVLPKPVGSETSVLADRACLTSTC
jgi:hypothetical protein